jgi:hypothetical protein
MPWPVSDWLRGFRRLPQEVAEPVLVTPAAPKRLVASVDQTAVADAHLDANVLHDLLVQAGANLDGHDVSVKLGAPRMVSSVATRSADGRSIDQETHLELTVSIVTRERLSLFLDAIAGASVENATLTLTPRPLSPAHVETHIEEARP